MIFPITFPPSPTINLNLLFSPQLFGLKQRLETHYYSCVYT